MAPPNMSDEQISMRDRLRDLRNRFTHSTPYDERSSLIDEMSSLAKQLHDSLTESGNPPRHHGYMIENRGCSPDSKDFYRHPHPVEDLIRFTLDVNANDDPEDVTLGVEFDIHIYSRRWGHDDTLTLERTESGWAVSSMEGRVECDRAGSPALYDHMDHESIAYPRSVGMWFEELWEKAASEGLDEGGVGRGLKAIANWINETEKSAPSGHFWQGGSNGGT